MTIPNFLVAGAGRSGTTGLVEGLRTHPQVFITQPKEPHYFALHGMDADFAGPGDAATINKVAVTDRARYLGLYPDDGNYRALGDGSVSTLYYADHAVTEILKMNPEMRVVVMLRDPVERAYSSYLYMRGRGFEPCDEFLDAVADEPRRRSENWHHLWHYVAMSRYADGLRTLQDGLGRDRVGVWFYDDLESDYETTVKSVLRFLDLPVDDHEAVGVPRVNVSGTPKNALFHRGIWWATRNELLRRSVKRMTSFRFRELVRRTALRPTGVPEAARLELQSRFDDDLRNVATLITGPSPQWLPQP